MTEEQTSQVEESQQTGSSEEQPNHGELIAESKRYRARAQEAEAKLAELQKAQKAAEDAKLAEQGEYKELLAKREDELAAASAKAAEWDAYQETRKNSILEGWTDEQKANFGDLPLSKIEALNKTFKQDAGKGKAPDDRPGSTKPPLENGGYASAMEFAQKDPEGYAKARGLK